MLALLRTIVELPKPVVARVDGARARRRPRPRRRLRHRGRRPATRRSRSPRCGSGSRPAIISLTTLGRMTERAVSALLPHRRDVRRRRGRRVGLLTAAGDDVDADSSAIADALRACSPQGLAETQAADHARACWPPSTSTRTTCRRCRRGCSPPTRPARACWRSCRSAGPRVGSRRMTARDRRASRSRTAAGPPGRGCSRPPSPASPSSAGAASTVAVVAERAGVSRGAAQHHFPTREDLFTAALEHVDAGARRAAARASSTERRGGPAGRGASSTSSSRSTPARSSAPRSTLWVAAAAEPQLREQIVAARGAHRPRDAPDRRRPARRRRARPGVRETVQATLDLARGLGLANLLTDDSRRRARHRRAVGRRLDATLSGRRPTC